LAVSVPIVAVRLVRAASVMLLKPNAALAGLLGLRAGRQQQRRQNPNDGLTTDSSRSVKA
jgi:hypothetical protein